jgi:hypothetical protein
MGKKNPSKGTGPRPSLGGRISAADIPLPASPRVILDNREEYEEIVFARRYKKIENENPLACLYRLYAHIMLDQNIEMRNHLEFFW